MNSVPDLTAPTSAVAAAAAASAAAAEALASANTGTGTVAAAAGTAAAAPEAAEAVVVAEAVASTALAAAGASSSSSSSSSSNSSSTSSAASIAATGADASPGAGALVATVPGVNMSGRTMHVHLPSGITILTQNVVATMSTHVTLNLASLACLTRNSEYNPQRFAAVILRLVEPKTTALIFGSGKVVVAGAKSVFDSKLACRKFGAIIRKVGSRDAKSADVVIQNIVCSCDCKFAIQLEKLALTHRKLCTFEPELFPGLVFRMVVPKVVLLIFVSGKVVITGAKDQQQSYQAFGQVYKVLLAHKKNDNVDRT